MKRVTVFVFLLFTCFSLLYSASSHAVPLDNNSYQIIRNAEIRNIIPVQSQVKPYTVDEVLTLLEKIVSSGELSDSEIKIVNDTILYIERNYGAEESKEFSDVLKNGFFRIGSDKITMMIGADISTDTHIGKEIGEGFIFDSRNKVNFTLRGDAFEFLSYDLNVSAYMNKINTHLYSFLDFPLSGQGNYFYLPSFDPVKDLDNSYGALISIGAVPAIRMNFIDNKIKVVLGSSLYEWGPSVNHNISLSSTATEMPGVAVTVKPFDWVEYSVLHASLVRFALANYEDVKWPSDNWHEKEGKYDNIFSIHRLDFRLGGFDLGLYESVVWRKRLELAYLNPIAIYQVAQNELGDLDNMIVGLDMSYVLKKIGKIYFGLSIDEINSISLGHFFSHPRHIFGVQFGLDFNSIFGSFSNLYLQTTYVAPFYGSHYEISADSNPWGGTSIMTQPVQRGRIIGYPLHPDSFEVLIGYSTIFPYNISFDFTIRNQMRSAQYSVNEYGSNNPGTTNFTVMDYSESNYEYKKLFENIWKNTLIFDVTASKSFTELPVEASLGFKLSLDWERSYDLTGAIKESSRERVNNYKYNPGRGVTYGEWGVPDVLFALGLGLKVYI